jgi:hypothetical protein
MTDTKDGCASSTAPTKSKLEIAGERAAAHMEALWKLDIFDPPKGSKHARAKFCLDAISDIIVYNGWGWALPYLGDGSPQWCGMAAGRAWGTAGLDPSWLASYWASTYRLGLWATYQRYDRKAKPNPAPQGITSPIAWREGARRLLVNIAKSVPDDVEPRLGDIIIVGDGDPKWGDHINVNMGYDASNKTFDTISGNGGGVGPRGNKREGVSRRDYTIGAPGYRPLWLVRPALSDLL